MNTHVIHVQVKTLLLETRKRLLDKTQSILLTLSAVFTLPPGLASAHGMTKVFYTVTMYAVLRMARHF